MHDISFVREHVDLIGAKLRDRNAGIDLAPFLALDERRRALLRDVEGLQQRRKQAHDRITRLRKANEDAGVVIAEMKDLAERIKGYYVQLKEIQSGMEEFLYGRPNLPHESVPVGREAADNVVVRTVGEKPALSF